MMLRVQDGTTRRGKSRMSKALPSPPSDEPSQSDSRMNPPPAPAVAAAAASLRSLPAHPKAHMPPNQMRIPRRPVGSGELKESSREPSTHSASSVYSETPGFSRHARDVSPPKREGGVEKEGAIERPLPVPPREDKIGPSLKEIMSLAREDSESPAISLSSSTGADVWRRRSARSDQSLSITDLYLTTSNNDQESAEPPSPTAPPTAPPAPISTTTIPSTVAPPSPAPQHPLPPVPSQAPAQSTSSPALGLPSRTVRKPLPQLSTLDDKKNDMGSKLSKVFKDGEKLRKDSPSKAQATRQPPVARLPTPEYLHTDNTAPPLEPAIISPESPETPPRDLMQQDPVGATPGLPASFRAGLPSNPRKGLPGNPKPPNLLLDPHSRQDSETLNVASQPAIVKSPLPQKAFAAAPILTPETSPPAAVQARAAPSPQNLPPAAFNMPLAPEGTVFPAMALTDVHLDCYQHHKIMRMSRNDICPVACAVCEAKDTEKRWMCNWCSLRCCEPCMKALTALPQRDLRRLLVNIGQGHRIPKGAVGNGIYG